MASIFHTGGDWVGVAEAAYRSSETDDEWALGVLDAVRGVIRAQWVSIICATFSEEHEPRMAAYGETFGEMGLRGLKELSMQDSAGFDLFFFPPSIINTQSSVDRRASRGTRRALRAYRAHFGIADALAAVANPTDSESAVLFAATHAPIALSRTNIELLTRAALHVEAGLRLRRHPEVIRAVVDTSGRAIHIEPGAPSRELLESHTRKVERARTRRARRAPEALDLWTALVDGRTSLIERFDGGKRYYLAVDNRPERRPLRALTRGELDVVSDAARGLTAKLIAYSHGISPSRVSSRLASATAKIGLARRVELVRLAALLCYPTRPALLRQALTTTEEQVLRLVTAGLSNAEVANRRNRSVRTIANQVARLLQKTGSPTRRALVARG